MTFQSASGGREGAPKADALPGCATPRTAEALRFPADLTQAERGVRGNERRNAARTGAASPGIVPEQVAERNFLASIPRRVSPSRSLVQEVRLPSPNRYVPVYHPTGELWFVMDTRDVGRTVFMPPQYGPPLPLRMEIDRLAARDPHKHRTVYFIGHHDHAIKIGVTGSLSSRLATLQSHSPLALEVMATRKGGELTELAYHNAFADHRLHGEWFRPHPDILAEIERLTAPVSPDGHRTAIGGAA